MKDGQYVHKKNGFSQNEAIFLKALEYLAFYRSSSSKQVKKLFVNIIGQNVNFLFNEYA